MQPVIFGIVQICNNIEFPFAREDSEKIWKELQDGGFLDKTGIIQPSFKPNDDGFELGLSEKYSAAESDIIAILQNYQLERHIRKDEEPKRLKINKQVYKKNHCGYS